MSWRTEKAYKKGRDAYTKGNALGKNPYTHETEIQSNNFRAWRLGWRDGAINDPLLDDDERQALLEVAR